MRGDDLSLVLTLVFLYCDHLRNGSLKYSNVPAGAPDFSHSPCMIMCVFEHGECEHTR